MGHLFGLSNMLKKRQQKMEGTNKMGGDHLSSQKQQQHQQDQPIKPRSTTKQKGFVVVGSAAKVVPHCDSSDSHGRETTKTVTATTATATNHTSTSTTTTTKATTATTNTPLYYLQLPYRGKEHITEASSGHYPSKPHPQNKRIRSRRYRNR